ncbi:MAG: MobA/MobL family protein [Alphaproteobacteria bacterium]
MIDYLYRLEARIISRRRADGGENSAVAAAAYRAGQRLEEGAEPKPLRPIFNQDEPSEIIAPTKLHAHDYRRRAGVMGSFIVAPKDAPAWTRDRGMLWNAVERAEQRKDSQLAREVIVNLPNLDIFDHLTPANKQKRLIFLLNYLLGSMKFGIFF